MVVEWFVVLDFIEAFDFVLQHIHPGQGDHAGLLTLTVLIDNLPKGPFTFHKSMAVSCCDWAHLYDEVDRTFSHVVQQSIIPTNS